ncbi:MAG: sigma-70 family RNA polymerase sigma factor [Oscillospiraceae bacterium]|jgi:RNA polymerase sigma-70 factor (ECF subfamily)|nr:sigma-70 family RNA polymerase sigma factor [Oscillospiraceae bacterium]
MENTLRKVAGQKMKSAIAAEEFTGIYEKTMPSVYRLCYSYLKNRADTQDMVHSVYVKLLQTGKVFDGDEHRKAWLFVTARNLCKNHLRHWWQRERNSLPDEDGGDGLFISAPAEDRSGVREAVLNLPEKYKILIFLYYYEGYNTNEIAEMLEKNNSTVRRQLAEARTILGGMICEEE